jgi:hypothetical protein
LRIWVRTRHVAGPFTHTSLVLTGLGWWREVELLLVGFDSLGFRVKVFGLDPDEAEPGDFPPEKLYAHFSHDTLVLPRGVVPDEIVARVLETAEFYRDLAVDGRIDYDPFGQSNTLFRDRHGTACGWSGNSNNFVQNVIHRVLGPTPVRRRSQRILRAIRRAEQRKGRWVPGLIEPLVERRQEILSDRLWEIMIRVRFPRSGRRPAALQGPGQPLPVAEPD